jgi:hypothetical protein
LVVLAHLRWRWILSGREGLGSSLPSAELARRDSDVFEELKQLFSTTPEVREETEANGGHRGDRTLDRTRSLFDRTNLVSAQGLRAPRSSDRTWWRVRSQSTERVRSVWVLIGLKLNAGTKASGATCSASGHFSLKRDLCLTSASGPLRD